MIREKLLIYDNVKNLADAQNMTISQIEREAGLSNGTIARWKSCEARVQYVMKVADVLGVTTEELCKQ